MAPALATELWWIETSPTSVWSVDSGSSFDPGLAYYFSLLTGRKPTLAVNPSPPRLKLRLTPSAERAVRGGHPWVYADRIKSWNREGESGELAFLYDRNDRFLAAGFFDPDSPIRVRILHMGKPEPIDDAWFRSRLSGALARRLEAFRDELTTGYRVVNGESDGLPGLVLDRYGATAVLKLYTAAWFPRLDILRRWVLDAGLFEAVVVRLSRNVQTVAAAAGLGDGQILEGGAGLDSVVFLENGKRFAADPLRGQKTGFFLDQRENRRIIGERAAGAKVLNVFSHAGGFSVYAAAGGARAATDIDISAAALEGARQNMALNLGLPGVRDCIHDTVQADAFPWLAEKARSGEAFDIVVIDPPSFAKRQSEREQALAAYQRLVKLGLSLVKPRGLLAAASCSAHVGADEFFSLVRETAARDRRACRELFTTQHAVDHPATFPEARYLKCCYVQPGGIPR